MSDIVQANGQVAPLQEFLINNAEALNKLDGVNVVATEIGNSTTGKPDDMLGANTGSILQTLILMAQLNSGVAPDDLNKDYNETTTSMLKAMLTNLGIEENQVNSFIEATKPISNGGRLESIYYGSADVDASTLKAPENNTAAEVIESTDLEVTNTDLTGSNLGRSEDLDDVQLGPLPFAAEVDGYSKPNFDPFSFDFLPSPTEIKIPFLTAVENVGVSMEVQSDPAVRTASMSYDEFDTLNDRVEDSVATSQENLVVLAYNSSKDQRAAEIGLTAKEVEYREVLERDAYGEQRELYGQANEIGTELKSFTVDVNGTETSINDVPLKLTLSDGQTMTMTYSEFDDNVNDWHDFLGESAREEDIRAAMSVEYSKLKEDSGYAAKQTEMDELNIKAQKLPFEHFDRMRELPMEIATLKGQLRNEDIQIVVPEGVTDTQMAAIVPSYEIPIEDDAVKQTLLASNP